MTARERVKQLERALKTRVKTRKRADGIEVCCGIRPGGECGVYIKGGSNGPYCDSCWARDLLLNRLQDD